MTDDYISRIRAALEAGPTPGPWVDDLESYGSASDVTIYSEARGELDYVVNIGYCGNKMEDGVYIAFDASAINARYIAACSPDRIERVLAELERLRAELADQRGVMRDLLADAALMKQRLGDAKLETARLRSELAKVRRDAERYRWLRDSKIADDADRWICAHECTLHEVAELDGERLDAAIDRARGAEC